MAEDPQKNAETAESRKPEEPSVEGLMADESRRDLDAEALAAATAAVQEAERALAGARSATAEPAGEPRSRNGNWILRVVLGLNLLLMGVVVALPDPEVAPPEPGPPAADPDAAGTAGDTGTDSGSAGGDAAPGPGPGTTETAPSPEQRRMWALQGDAWHTALRMVAEDGRHEEAASLLADYEETARGLTDVERQLLYSQIAHYLIQAGRDQDARDWLRKANSLLTRSYLPEDVLEMARQAEDDGQGGRMRRMYAHFLLTQKLHTTEMHRYVAEAYLKLGDSYRIQAERGEERAQVVNRARESALRRKTREHRARGEEGR